MKEGHSFTIRTKPSTSASVITVISNPSVNVPCTTHDAPCTRENNGGSYTCWSGGPHDNDWFKVRWGQKTGWVAAMCVDVGRIG